MTNYKYKLFGRFRGRKKIKLTSIEYYNKYKVNTIDEYDRNQKYILDIGSGSGENAIALSKKFPSAKIITCELFEDGNINLINNIIENKIENIYLFHGNVLKFFDELKKINIFDQIWILFPDPWPKRRHHKRRLINDIFLKRAHNLLKNSGNMMIATDSPSYMKLILRKVYDFQGFYLWQNQKFDQWDYNHLDLPKTKFYKKALKSNRKSMLFNLIKI